MLAIRRRRRGQSLGGAIMAAVAGSVAHRAWLERRSRIASGTGPAQGAPRVYAGFTAEGMAIGKKRTARSETLPMNSPRMSIYRWSDTAY
jgi:hypothetical protein